MRGQNKKPKTIDDDFSILQILTPKPTLLILGATIARIKIYSTKRSVQNLVVAQLFFYFSLDRFCATSVETKGVIFLTNPPRSGRTLSMAFVKEIGVIGSKWTAQPKLTCVGNGFATRKSL